MPGWLKRVLAGRHSKRFPDTPTSSVAPILVSGLLTGADERHPADCGILVFLKVGKTLLRLSEELDCCRVTSSRDPFDLLRPPVHFTETGMGQRRKSLL